MPDLDKIAAYYSRCGSIKQTAAYFGLGYAVTRKSLITAGAYESETYRDVKNLLDQGMTLDQIAEKLHLSASAINANIPYSKGNYKNDHPSVNALRVRKHRENKGDKNNETF